MTKKSIVWEPHYYEYIENRKMFKSSEDDELEDDDSVFSEEYEEEGQSLKNMLKGVNKLIQTPLGMFQVDDALNPYRQYKMWMAHCNFDITPAVLNTIKKIPGVEILYVITRYRFLVAIAENFDKAKVRYTIQTTLCGDEKAEVNPIEAKILDIKQQLSGYDKWAIYIFPNGNYSFTALQPDHSNIEEYERDLNLFQESEKLSKGQLITHES